MPGASNGISLQKLKNRNANIHTASDGRPTPNTCAWTVNAPSSGMNQKTKMPSRAGRFEKSMDTKDLFSAEKPGPINFTIDYNNWAAEDPNQNDLKISPPFGASIERPKSAPATKWINKDSPVHMPGIIMSTTELNGDVVSQKFHSSQSPIMFNHQRPKSGGPLLKANFPYHARISPTGAVNPNRMEEMYSRGDIAVSIEERLSSLISPSAGIPDQLQIPNNCDDDYLLPLKKEINVPSDDSVFYDNDAFDGSFYKGELKPLGANYIPSKPSEKKAGPRADVFLNHAHQPYPSSQHATPPPYRVLPSYQASLHKNIHGRYNGPENPQQLFHKATQPSLLRSPQRETRLSLQSSNNRPNPVGESSPSSQNSSFISNRAESYISYRKPGSVTLQPVEIRNTHFPNQNLSFADSYRNSNYGIGIRLYPDLPFTNSNSATNSQIRDPNSLLMDDFPGAYYSSELDSLHERNNQIIEQNKRINNISSNDTIYPLETNTVAVERRDITHNINMPSRDNCDFDDGKSLSSADTDSSDTDIPKLGDPFADLALELSHAIDSDMESNRTITPPLPPLSPTTSESVTVSSPHHRDKAFMAAKRDSLKSKTSQNISPQTSPEFDVRRKKSVLRRNASQGKRFLRLGMKKSSSESDMDSLPNNSRNVQISPNAGTSQTEMPDASIIHQKLDGLEVMYHEILKIIGVEKDFLMTSERNSAGALEFGRRSSKRFNTQKSRNKDMKIIDKRFARLESHVVTLARSVAHLSSEMRQNNLIIDELEAVKHELILLKQQNNPVFQSDRPLTDWEKFRKWVSSITNPRRVEKLRRFFGEDPLIRLFLEKLGYQKYVPRFDAEKIGMIELPYLTEDRLQRIGIPMGPRLRILQEAQLCFRQENLDIYII